MGLVRFEQLRRYLHIEPIWPPALQRLSARQVDSITIESQLWWHKLEPMISSFRTASEQLYMLSTNIAINELMIKCFRRSHHTCRMPNKPIKQGYKIFAIADQGYI